MRQSELKIEKKNPSKDVIKTKKGGGRFGWCSRTRLTSCRQKKKNGTIFEGHERSSKKSDKKKVIYVQA